MHTFLTPSKVGPISIVALILLVLSVSFISWQRNLHTTTWEQEQHNTTEDLFLQDYRAHNPRSSKMVSYSVSNSIDFRHLPPDGTVLTEQREMQYDPKTGGGTERILLLYIIQNREAHPISWRLIKSNGKDIPAAQQISHSLK